MRYHTGPWISKYSTSGAWNGELFKAFNTLEECMEYLKDLATKRENVGYDVSLSDDGRRLDLAHDDLADAFTYIVEPGTEE